MKSIDDVIAALPKVRRDRLRRRVLALIAAEAASSAKPDPAKVVSLKRARERRRNGPR